MTSILSKKLPAILDGGGGAVGAGIVPIGTSLMWNMEIIPDGFFIEDGSLLLQSEFPELFAIIGIKFGWTPAPIGEENFRLPDSRGYFPRFTSLSSGIDPEAGSRANGNGSFFGDIAGTNQSQQIQSHSHTYWMGGLGPGGHPVSGTNANNVLPSTNAAGGTETRPINTYKTAIIRAY